MYSQLISAVRKAWHAHALFWGKNDTQESATRSCVVIAPHPDDETIGMGATIARKIKNGSRVVLIVATDGRYSQESDVISMQELIDLRKTELYGAAHALGIDKSDIYFLEEIDTKIELKRLKSKLIKVLDSLDFSPDELMTTSWYDGHKDHQKCARATREIAQDRNIVLRCCPIYWWAEGPSRFHRENHSRLNRQFGKFLDLKHAFLERGWVNDCDEYSIIREEALRHYASQTSQLTGEDKWATLDEEWLKRFNRRREYFIKM